ncbi:5'/3'-nucleotidase SurE [Moorella sulfitireducens (nom. illeg.)]|uniref:5'/3'-nucleotidase SurE n=1 Tax=Neomoorella sulfitireducens TaxID=2972948 RepID=UPI0021AC8681|nr:5'/3'-nucleotidase SurE [Moorella sulfitireducens]
MVILLTNDDGIYAPGIKALSLALAAVGKVVVVAPERERSAIGHGITMHKPLRVTEVPWEEPIGKGLAINGTPADCVKLALDALLDEPAAMVISGINRGENLGTDVLYSGTVSGAIEGCINGLPSLAVSLVGEEEFDFTFAASFTTRLAREILKRGLPPGTLLNVNIPQLPENKTKGIAITRLGRRRYVNTISTRRDPRGRAYYWLAGEKEDIDQGPDTDIGALSHGFISITPLQLDLTHYAFQQELKAYLPGLWPGHGNK